MRSLLVIIGMMGLGIVHAQTPIPPAQTDVLGLALRAACWKGDLNEATKLLDEGAPLEGRDNLGRTPLFLACHGDPAVVKMLLARGAKIDAAENDGDLPIAHACEFGDLASAQMLLNAGADFSQPNKYARTPLILAARGGHDDLVSLLISHHVDVNYNGPSCSALYYAIWRDHLSTAKLLLDAGASPNVLTSPADPLDPSATMLSWAAVSNDFALIDLLLAHGVDLNGKSGDGTTALMVAMRSAKPETVEYLLNKQPDVNIQDDRGETALMFAINYDQEQIWQHLIKCGAKLEVQDNKGCTVLMASCRNDYPPAIRFLIDQGADVHVTDFLGNTALTYAANHGDLEMVQFLETKGASSSDIHIINREKLDPPLPLAHSWALAVGAIYAQTNGTNPEALGSDNPDPRDSLQRRLKEDWDVTDKKSFLNQIYVLSTRGHRTEFRDAGARLAALSDEDFQRETDAAPLMTARAKAVRNSYLKWKERTGLAWDLCRRANLINLGYAAHYLNETEAWELLMGVAQQTQSNFSSWQEMSDNFLDGREIWAGHRDPKFEAAAQLLLNPRESNSPWNQHPWNTDLSGN
jgi:ankyrin repeat protein